MGAIFGFTGQTDANLRQRMAAALAHRGRAGSQYDETPAATLGYLARFEEPIRCRHGSGLYVEGERAIALAGFLTGHHPSLPEILAQYVREGIAALGSLRGAFVLALRDGDTIHLVRDGAGARTVYYARHDGRWLFAAEPKGVLATPGFPRRIRPGAVAQYLTFSFVPGSDTMLEGLYELLPGHAVSLSGDAQSELRRLFVFETVEKEDGSAEHWTGRFREEFGRAVADRLPPEGRVGLFLSGGVDSSIVAAELARQCPQRLKSYAIHFGPDLPHELDFARAVAERLRIEHEEVLIRPRAFLPRLRKMVWHLDEPIGDPITMPNFELSSHVGRETCWVFNGEGGDPLFGGPKNIPMLLHHWYGGIDRADRFRERMYLASYRRCYDELDHLLTPDWRARFDRCGVLEDLLTPFFVCERPAQFLDKLTAMNIRLKGAHLILPKIERMTAAWGLVPLAPLFDERLILLSFRMPTTMKLCRGVEKVVLKRAYENELPRSVIDRPKSGMRVPVHYWFQGELKRYARKILNPREICKHGIFDPVRVKQLLDYNTEEGPGRYGLRLWMLLTFEIWRRIVVEGEEP